MTSSSSTLRGLFNDLQPGENVAAVEKPALLSELQPSGANVEWSAALPDFTATVAELLDLKVSTFFLAAWKKLKEVKAALAESNAKPEETITLQLIDYSTEATFEPSIEVRLGGVKPGTKITLTVTLPLAFKGVILTIQAGEITRVKTGECEINGSVALAKLALAKLKKPVTFKLGPEFVLQEK